MEGLSCECRKSHDNYLYGLLDPCTDKCHKRLWTYVATSIACGVSSLELCGELCSDDETKAKLLSNHFASIYTRENLESIPITETSYPTSDCININVEGVTKLLYELNTYKACGIPSCLLKETASNVASMLTLIFNASLKQGKIADDWKKALVIPVFKGAKTCLTNYRPILFLARYWNILCTHTFPNT